MMKYYLLRLDDACPTMNFEKWKQVEGILDRYGIKPMVGVIPNNENPHEIICEANSEFWDIVKSWENKGWAIAMHGYNHCYTSNDGLKGLNPMWERSEFAGLPLSEQKEKIRKGVAIMRTMGFNPRFFFAPSHTFDDNTLTALYDESNIRFISDTVALSPYNYKQFVLIPQIVGSVRKMHFPGVFTFCYHPNTMQDRDFSRLEDFICNNTDSFISFDGITVNDYGKKKWFDIILTEVYFFYRKLRKLR